MAGETKKISFGFSKTIKKQNLNNVDNEKNKRVDYIEYVDNSDKKAIKIIGDDGKEEGPLVIPLRASKTWHDRIINHIDADIFEQKVKLKNESNENTSTDKFIPETKNKVAPNIIKVEPLTEETVQVEQIEHINTNRKAADSVQTKIKQEPQDETLTLEELAAKEIVAELNSSKDTNELPQFTVPVTEEHDLEGKEESTLEDYEQIPIEAFGTAMLRGMGWAPGKGIGKNEQLIAQKLPELRPKGMGLGADKMLLKKLKENRNKQGDNLVLKEGSCIKILFGKHSSMYGKVKGFDEEAGRLIVKLSLSEEDISINDNFVQVVTEKEYADCAKVLNIKSYEANKKNGATSEQNKNVSKRSESTDSEQDRKKDSKSSTSKAKYRKRSSSRDSHSDSKKKRRKRDSDFSSDDDKQKKPKKSKHKKRDHSSDRNRDKKKKEKKSKKSKHKKSERSHSSDRQKRKEKR